MSERGLERESADDGIKRAMSVEPMRGSGSARAKATCLTCDRRMGLR